MGEGITISTLQFKAEKRDRVADFVHFCEGMAELAKAEGKRLQARQKHFEATAERVSAMVLRVLDYLGVKRLEGRTNTLKWAFESSSNVPPPSEQLDIAKGNGPASASEHQAPDWRNHIRPPAGVSGAGFGRAGIDESVAIGMPPFTEASR
jgi:hypothetical protein